MTQEADLDAFRTYVDESRWQFAKTYVDSYPHEYNVERWGDPATFGQAILCIERWGVVEPFWGTHKKYLHVGDRKYWHMGDPNSEDPEKRPGLINRTWLDVSRYRENARSLGYDGADLDRLAERWEVLLVRARRGSEDASGPGPQA
jgi:hypothetical protein